jgi:uncharacterized PurR-regulated membrane protein YhhQ (DUF165 family)
VWGRGIVSSFEAGVRANPRVGSRHSVADAGIGRGGRVYGRPGEDSLAVRIGAVLGAGLRLVVPVALLLVTGVAAFLYSDIAVSWITGPSESWLTLGQALLPLTFLAIHLTNRRYGASYAFVQVIAAWVIGAFAFNAGQAPLSQFAHVALPGMREIAGFGFALFAAQLTSVFVFDRTRGPRWWSGPLFASLWAGAVLCFVAYPLSYAGTDADWVNHMFVNLWLAVGTAVALLIPYWMFRSVVPPLSGFNGY